MRSDVLLVILLRWHNDLHKYRFEGVWGGFPWQAGGRVEVAGAGWDCCGSVERRSQLTAKNKPTLLDLFLIDMHLESTKDARNGTDERRVKFC